MRHVGGTCGRCSSGRIRTAQERRISNRGQGQVRLGSENHPPHGREPQPVEELPGVSRRSERPGWHLTSGQRALRRYPRRRQTCDHWLTPESPVPDGLDGNTPSGTAQRRSGGPPRPPRAPARAAPGGPPRTRRPRLPHHRRGRPRTRLQLAPELLRRARRAAARAGARRDGARRDRRAAALAYASGSSVSGSWRENPRKGVQVRRACADT